MGSPEREVTEQEIETLVHEFYARVRSHPSLGAFFARHLRGEDWPAHLALMCDFWSSTLRASRRYHGNPRLAHQRLPGLSHGHFRDWLALFREVAEKVLEPVHAVDVLRKAEKMGFHLARAAVPGPMPEA